MDCITLECLKEREQAVPEWLPPAGLELWTAQRCVRGEERVSQWMMPALRVEKAGTLGYRLLKV